MIAPTWKVCCGILFHAVCWSTYDYRLIMCIWCVQLLQIPRCSALCLCLAFSISHLFLYVMTVHAAYKLISYFMSVVCAIDLLQKRGANDLWALHQHKLKHTHKKWYSITEITLVPQDTKGSNNYCYATCATSRLWCHYTSTVSPDSACLHFFAVPMLLSVCCDALHAVCAGRLRWYPGHIPGRAYSTLTIAHTSLS